MNMEINKKIGKKMLMKRKELGYAQEEFAHEIGMSPCHYGKIERGEANASVYSLKRIADGFCMKPYELLMFDDID